MVSREHGKILYGVDVGMIFPYSLPRSKNQQVLGVVGSRGIGFEGVLIIAVKAFRVGKALNFHQKQVDTGRHHLKLHATHMDSVRACEGIRCRPQISELPV